MEALQDPTHIGMFEPHELNVLHEVHTKLSRSMSLGGDEARERSLARSILKLYRHGVKDPDQLFDALHKS